MRRLRDAVASYFYGSVRRERVTFLVRIFAFVFAFDVWFNMLEHGWRYGADGFNVAHFGWLTALQPVPSPGWYVGLVGAASLAAFAVALGVGGRRLIAAAGLAFSYSWMMSMLDSYQHHYMLSLVFVCCVGMPVCRFGGAGRDDSSGAEGGAGDGGADGDETGDGSGDGADDPTRDDGWIEAWGYPLFCSTLTCVYGFAAYAKAEPSWRDGEVMRMFVGAEGFRALDLWQWFGGGTEMFWETAGLGVVVGQLGLALIYGLAPLFDRREGVAWRVLQTLGWCTALGFHVSIELLDFSIQWFSYYMIAVAFAVFGPLAPLRWLDRGLARTSDRLLTPARRWLESGEHGIVLGLCAATIAVVALVRADLPGTGWLAAGLGISILACFVSDAELGLRRGLRAATAGLLAAVCMWGSVEFDHTRFDFHRYAGGDLRRRLPGAADLEEKRRMLEDALHHYRHAEQYAPPGETRRDDVRQLQNQLESIPPRDE